MCADLLRRGLLRIAWSVVLAGVCVSAWCEEKAFSVKAYRHNHFFLVWNESGTSPRVSLQGVKYGKYTDGLQYRMVNADSRVLKKGEVGAGERVEVSDLPPSARYLVAADPGYNGVVFAVDRPYGIVARQSYPLGLNHPSGCLYFYVPPACRSFRVGVQCASPKEGARIVVRRPDGSQAAEFDGELDEVILREVTVPEECPGSVWALEFLEPTAPGTYVDDVNVFLEGELPPLVAPRKDWAARIGKEVWRIDGGGSGGGE